MQALLDFDQSPPLRAPLRFFLTAPVFGLLAGALVLWSGPALWASRWTAPALALTHLMTAGFMLQVMLGALLQLLPVVAGANIAQPQRLAAVVHTSLTLGTIALVAAFLHAQPLLFASAALLLGFGVIVFMVAVIKALWGVGASQPTVIGMKLALIGLGLTVGLGMTLALALGRFIELPLLLLTQLHLGWGLLGWAGVLVTAVAYVVVPMFQITPPFPVGFTRWALPSTTALLVAWSGAALMGWSWADTVLQVALVLTGAVLAATTLQVTRRTKRAQSDATQRLWQIAMISLLLASALWLGAASVPALAQWPSWPPLWAVLVVYGGMVSVITGMLNKIVPFLIWLHLRHQGQGKVHAPNVKVILPESATRRQLVLHLLALALLVLASVWPHGLAYPAGVALMVAQGALLHNLLKALRLYRQHQRRIADCPPRAPRPPHD